MPTFEQFCENNNLNEEVKEKFSDYVMEGALIEDEGIVPDSETDYSEEDLKSELKDFQSDYPELFEEGDEEEDFDEDDEDD